MLPLIVNVYVASIDFLSKLSILFRRKQPLNYDPKNRCSQNLIQKMKSYDLLKMDSFTNTLQEFSQDFKQHCIPFEIFKTPLLQKVFQYLLMTQVQRYCVIACTCWFWCVYELLKDSWIHSAFINDIQP